MAEQNDFGAWPSPLSASDIARGGARLGGLMAHAGTLVFAFTRADEAGRTALTLREGTILPTPWNVRSRLNEYGGLAFWSAGDAIHFVEDSDQAIHALDPQTGAVTPFARAENCRFADGAWDPVRSRAVAVMEDHAGDGHPTHSIVALTEGSAPAALVTGRDFFGAPCMSPDGSRMAWLAWDLPWMPWQTAELWLADLDETGVVSNARLVGGGLNRAAFQPEWSAEGVLHAVLEDSHGSALHRYGAEGWERLGPETGEAGRPLWWLGSRSYALFPDGRLVASVLRDGAVTLEQRTPAGEWETVDHGFADVANPTALANGALGAQVRWPDRAESVEVITGTLETQASTLALTLPAGVVAKGERKSFETEAGPVHAVYYPPTNDAMTMPASETPPMIVAAHGGPTGYADRGFVPKIQFWTSRGFAYLDVDYRGSFGYGPAYRRALDGLFGIADVEDVVRAAAAAATDGLADAGKLFVTGGSSGGFVVLAALAFHDVFRAGCSRYGIGDLKQLLATTHKFESGYLDTLLGLTGDASADNAVMEARSPLNHVDRITAPLLLLQGDEDRIVPPDQSRDMAAALKAQGTPVAYLEFAGEGHGFRAEAAVRDALLSELHFYRTILGLDGTHEDEAPPDMTIHNWPSGG
ncbi:MAG: prolyl oligopeptidase family serine peptidase [Pseudomonadota bacterium]